MKFVAVILFVFSSLISFAQFSVQGTVIDGETNTSLPGANVFIANTTKGVSTDRDGKFRIDGLLATQYQVVVSFIGYETQAFGAVAGQQINYKVLLRPSIKTLREVVVRARKMSRVKRSTYLRSFKEHFIGKSDNALACRFINTDVLVLDKEGDVLTAETDSTLVLVNNGLGYRIKILLETYKYNSRKDAIHYEGHMVYEILKPSNQYQKRRWAKNRLKAYYGSEMHFLRSLYNHQANEEGYYFYFVNPLKSDTIARPRSKLFNNRHVKIHSITNYDRVLDSARSTKEAPILKFSDPLEINYLHEGESVVYQRTTRVRVQKAQQVSRIKLRAPAMILPDGRIAPVNAAEVSGYWGWELMSETLPLDYEPEEDLQIVKRSR